MNKIVNKILLAGNKILQELHVGLPGFTYSACGPFSKHREIIQKFIKTGNLKHIRDKVKVVSDLSNYTTKKNQNILI